MHRSPIRLRPLFAGQIRWRWIKPVLEPNIVIQLRRQGQSQVGVARAVEIFAHRALSQVEARRVPEEGPGRVSDEQYATMTPGEKFSYARQHSGARLQHTLS